MTEPTKLDIAQKIVAAMTRTDEPSMTATHPYDAETDTVVGELPLHMRHLHNLVTDILKDAKEVQDAGEDISVVAAEIRAAQLIFNASLMNYVGDIDREKFSCVQFCADWKIVAQPKTVHSQ